MSINLSRNSLSEFIQRESSRMGVSETKLCSGVGYRFLYDFIQRASTSIGLGEVKLHVSNRTDYVASSALDNSVHIKEELLRAYPKEENVFDQYIDTLPNDPSELIRTISDLTTKQIIAIYALFLSTIPANLENIFLLKPFLNISTEDECLKIFEFFLSTISPIELEGMIFHELGHIRCRHVLNGQTSTMKKHLNEYEADEVAVKSPLAKRGLTRLFKRQILGIMICLPPSLRVSHLNREVCSHPICEARLNRINTLTRVKGHESG